MAPVRIQLAFCYLIAITTVNCVFIPSLPWYNLVKNPEHLGQDDGDLVELFKQFDHLKANSSFDLILLTAKELQNSNQTTERDLRLLDQLLNLTQLNTTCSADEAEFFLQAQTTLTSSKKLKNRNSLSVFLNHFGSKKFHECALKAIRKLEIDSEQIQGELAFFQRAVTQADYPNCLEVGTKLGLFNPSEDDWNIQGLAESLGHPSDRLFLAIVGVAFSHCDKIAARYNEQLIFINIATNFNSDTNYFDGCSLPHRVSEVYRICCEMQIFESNFRLNVERQIEAFVHRKRFQWLQPNRLVA